MKHLDQMSLLASRLPLSDFITPKELAAASGFSVNFILSCMDTGKLLGLQANGAAKKGAEVRRHTRIPREAAILWLMRHANFTDEDYMQNLCTVLDMLPRNLLTQAYQHAGRKLQKS